MTEPIYVESLSAVVTDLKSDRTDNPTRTIKDQMGQPRAYWMWGPDNQKPRDILHAVNSNLLLPTVIEFKVKALVSGGLVCGVKKTTPYGEILEPMHIPEIQDFFEMTEIEQYCTEAADDKYTLGNIAPEILLNMRREVVGIQELDMSECRLEKQVLEGRQKGRIRNVLVSSNWDKSVQEDLTPVAAVDPHFDVIGQIRDGNLHKYALPLRNLTRGVKYYQRGPLENLINSGWLDVANAIPKWKQAVMDKQFSIKYHIQINEAWLEWKFSDWHDVDDATRNKRKKEIAKEFSDVMEGEENAGKTVLSTFKMENGQEIVGWKIEPVGDTKFGEKAYIEDATHSDMHIVISQLVDPSSFGLSGKIGMGAGSGSDKEMAFNQHLLLTLPDQRQILRPIHIAAKLNKWQEKYGKGGQFDIQFLNYHIATLAQHAQKSEKKQPTPPTKSTEE